MGDEHDELWARARAAWPAFEVDAAAFGSRVAELRAEDGASAAVHAADLYLACACAGGVPAAIAALDRDVLRDVPRFVERFRGGAAFVDEVVQQLRDKLLVGPPPRMAEYRGRGPLRAWVRVAATRLALDLLRARAGSDEVTLDDALAADPTAGPELEAIKARFRDHFQAAFEAAIAALTPRQRTLLRLHHLDGLSLDRLAIMHRVHRATIARWLADARDEIAARTYDDLAARADLAPSELDSVVALVRSQLDVSLSRVLRR